MVFPGRRFPSPCMDNRDKTKDQISNELTSLRLYVKNIEDRDGMLFDRNPALSMIIDSNSRIENANKVFLANMNYLKDEVMGQPVTNFIIEKQRAAVLAQIEKDFKGEEAKEIEVGFYAKDGSVRTVLFINSQLLFQEEERPLSILMAGVDITARKKAEEVLERLEEGLKNKGDKLEQVLSIDQRISSIHELNHLVDFIVEKATEILGAQRCSLMLLDMESQELLIKGAKGLDENIIKETRVKLGESISGLVARDFKPLVVVNIETDSIVARKNNPSYKSKSFLSVPIKLHDQIVGVVNVADKDPQGEGIFTQTDLKILSMIVQQAAIAIENVNHLRELEYLSMTDSLTGIYNHRYFMRALEEEVERSKRYARSKCLLMFDIDDFKSYNDTYGHLEGDQALKEISQAVRKNLRTVDKICRYAGDEFVIILPETNIFQAEIIAEKIKKVILNLKLKRVVTLSMGIAAFHKNIDGRDLILKTDQALYQAKKEGKDMVCCLP